MSAESLPRSYLYVPGNAADKLTKALGRGADALIVDLEDAVPLAEKDNALAAVRRWLSELPADLGPQVWVRVNAGDQGDAEIAALADASALTGFALAKTESAADVDRAASVLAAAGDERLVLMPLIESGAAVLDVAAIARASRVHRLQIGEVDLAGDLGLDPGPDEAELAPMRAQVVIASAAAGIAPPVGPVSRIIHDVEAFRASTVRVRRQGFVGRACIHPVQVSVTHEVFAPTPDEVAEARDVLDRLDAAEAAGSGVVLDSEGRLVDPAVIRHARKTLALAARGSA
jgi:citrate lyase subunit beta / citryl-CoA lyase